MKRTICARSLALLGSALLVGSLSSGTALAKGPRPAPSQGRCWVDPNPVTDGQRFTVWGSGFAPNQNYTIFVGSGTILMTASDSLGLFTSWDWAKFRDPAQINVTVYAQSDSRHRNVLATCSFNANGS